MTEQPAQPEDPVEPAEVPMSFEPTGGLLRARILDPPPRPGLLGRIDQYEVLRFLGEGGMGVVFLAREPAGEGRVAVKVLRPELAGHPQAVRRFLLEARHAHDMRHPNILRVLALSDRPTGPYYVMPFMPRGSLAKLIRSQQRLSRELVISIARDVAEALRYAHALGIIHRDVKPSNVLLDTEGRAYLADFGLIRTVYDNSLIDVGHPQRVGTAPYMSPAVAAGEAEDTRCDIYSFGALMYEMLTGRPPYEGRSAEQIIQQILSGPPLPIRERNPEVPDGLAKVAEWAMARELRDRYTHMGDVVADLDRLAGGREPLGPHGREGARGRDALRRGVLAAALVLALGGVTALSFRTIAGSRGPAGATGRGLTAGKVSPPGLPPRVTFNLAYLPGPAPAGAADIADLDGDGILDIFCGRGRPRAQSQGSFIYWGRGKRKYTVKDGLGGGRTALFGLKVADFTGDRRLDALVLHAFAESPSLLFERSGDGFLQRRIRLARADPTGGNGCQGLAVGDLDGDGDLDVVCGHRGDYGPWICFNDGKGNFTPTCMGDWGAHDDIELADMDNDGDLDIVDSGPVDGWAGHSAIYWNAGDGTFPQRTLFHNVPEHHGISLADIDRDGDVDIALGIGRPDPAVVYRNEGNHRFVLHARFKPHTNVVLADLDGNAIPELITNGVEGSTGIVGEALHIYWDCDPNGQRVDTYAAPGWPDAICGLTIVVADLDADRVPDIFVDGRERGNFILWGKADAREAESNGRAVPRREDLRMTGEEGLALSGP